MEAGSLNEFSDPILDCEEAHEWESQLLDSDDKVWDAMTCVGKALGHAIRSDYSMTRLPVRNWNVLVLAGKGHNGGDALLAVSEMAKQEGQLGSVTIVLSAKEIALKPNTMRALERLRSRISVECFAPQDGEEKSFAVRLRPMLEERAFDLCIDGLLGMQFRPPLRVGIRTLLESVNRNRKIGLKVAVDLPSGVGEERDNDYFKCDLTYATGIYKRPLLGGGCGVIRYLDIGFFEKEKKASDRVIKDRILDGLRTFRPAEGEKRQFGHLVILAGSRHMPGALAMCVRAALKSGVGLVTVCAPESIVSQLACTLPEAMWRTWPETPDGSLALEGLWQVKALQGKASSLLVGPGLGADPEVLALLSEIGKIWEKPAVLDADALRKEVVDTFVRNSNDELVLTPHDGEFKRIAESVDADDAALMQYVARTKLCVVKKGSATRVTAPGRFWVNTTGNGVLSRGGSGDLLAGLIGGNLAQGASPFLAAARSVYWHGKAADLLAVSKGQTAISTTELLDFLPAALQAGPIWSPNSHVSTPL